MAIIEKFPGCPPARDECMGPVGEYYTIFGTELGNLLPHAEASIILGLILFGALFYLNKKKRIKMPLLYTAVVPIVVTILLFFSLAYFFPVVVHY